MVHVLDFLQQVKQLADFKTAELNAKVLQLESHIHWLQQDNQRLQEELQNARQSAAAGSGGQPAAGSGLAALQVRMGRHMEVGRGYVSLSQLKLSCVHAQHVQPRPACA